MNKIRVVESKTNTLRINSQAIADMVKVFIEDYHKGAGSITIVVCDESWSFYWGAMGDFTMSSFFIKASTSYLAGKLSNVKKYEVDYDKISLDTGEDINSDTLLLFEDKLRDTYGDDWYIELPEVACESWKYLTEIIEVVKLALAEVDK